ncbi:VWA domain-containing protein [Cryobacterium sp. TMB1-7]|nr:VWA domain-containing protein [Cryobacterium sp. TMB1-7]
MPAAPNPAMAAQCEVDFAISLDLSNSVTDPQLQQAREELAELANALEGYPVRFAVSNFASNAPATNGGANAPLPLTSVADAAGVDAIVSYVNGLQRPVPAQGGTNWDRGLAAIAGSTENYDALFFLTDGNPTQYADPVQGPGNSTNQATIDAAVSSANVVKGEGTRIVPIGVNDNIAGGQLAMFREHITQISGPAEGDDYHLAGFAALASTLIGIVNTNCASIDLEKTGTLADGATGTAGDVVDYEFTVTNTGTVALTDVTLADPKPGLSSIEFGIWPGAPGVLEPTQSVTATASYTLTEADVTAGEVSNTATTSGIPPAGTAVTDEAPALVTLPELTPGISLEKTGVLAGDTIAYSFTATNTGNVTLTAVSIADELEGVSEISYGAWPAATGVLAPGQSVTATASYAITQADRDAGTVANTATTTGTPPSGPPVSDEDDFDQPLAGAPALNLVKTGVLAGDTIAYSFTATNTGNVTLSAVTIADELDGLSEISYGTWPAATGVLAPGQSVTATASYLVTQADRDAGTVDNTATTTGTPPSGPPVSDEDDFDQPLDGTPALNLVKTGVLDGNTIAYSFTATNTGSVTLSSVTIADELEGLSEISYGTWPAAKGVLAPGQSVTATASYAITQADRDAGTVANTATTTGTPPSGPPVSDEDDFDQPLDGTPALNLVKTGVLDGNTIAYSFTATNTGDVTLTAVSIADELKGLSELQYGEWPAVTGVLAPGQSVTATATYAVTQADRDAGTVHNTATTTGTPPGGGIVTDEDEFDQPLGGTPSVSLVKTGVLSGNTIAYTFVATNSGTVTLSSVSIEDALDGLSDVSYGAWPAGAGVLAPGQSVTATASYTLTQADLDAGLVSNTATVTGTPPHGPVVSDKDTFELPLVDGPAISLVKTGVVHGDTITFTFVVTNTGNVSLTSVSIADELRGLSAITYGAWPNAQGELAPGASVTATATYAVTDADKSAGFVSNKASVTATPPTGPEITDRDDVRVTLKSVGALAHTGVDSDLLRGAALFSLLTILVGAAAMFMVRRKHT